MARGECRLVDHGTAFARESACRPRLAFGHVGIILTILLLGAVPLAGDLGLRPRRPADPPSRGAVWAAATYALLPALTGAVAAGRLGTAILGWLLPLIVLLVLRAVRLGSRWTATWLAVLLLAAAEAFVPLLWLATAILAIAVLAVGAARRGTKSLWRGRSATARLLAMVVVPPLLLLPWSWDVATHPTRLWLEAGRPRPGPSTPSCPPGRSPWHSLAARWPAHAGSCSAR